MFIWSLYLDVDWYSGKTILFSFLSVIKNQMSEIVSSLQPMWSILSFTLSIAQHLSFTTIKI